MARWIKWVVCFSVISGSLFAYTVYASEKNLIVERAVDWENLFKQTSGWTGADGIYSIPLSGRDAPGNSYGDHTLFVFSDTFIGEVGPNGVRLPGTTLVNNTLALMRGGEPNAEQTRFFWRTDRNGQPKPVFVPQTPNADREEWYWLMDGLSLNGNIYLFALRMKEGTGGVFNFAVDGVALLSSPLPSPNPPRVFDQYDLPLFVPADGNRGEIIFGGSVMTNTPEAGSPFPDGYVYVYGTQNDPLNKKLIAARVLPEHFENMDLWTFWDGSKWSESIESVVPLTGRISSEFSVSPLPDGRFVVVFQLDGLSQDVALRIGESPVGPFGQPVSVWRCPEPDYDPDIFVYNAKAHPHLSLPGELLISYNVNTFDFWDHFLNADIYRPRFIRIKSITKASVLD
jgi:hypothetical protein